MDKVRVLVADEASIFLEGVCAMLRDCEDIEVVGNATNGKETIERVRELAPDVVLMNLVMPIMDGADVTHRIRKENSRIKVLLLTQYEDRDSVLIGLKAGVDGYIPKRASVSDLVSAILAVYRGGCFLYPSVAKTMLDDYIQRTGPCESPDSYDQLTDREREVLKLVVEGHRSREISNLLDITVRTAEGHRANIMRKLSIHNWTELVKYAVRKHLITLEN
ncbi:response regulator [Chloroflexota bacterium]